MVAWLALEPTAEPTIQPRPRHSEWERWQAAGETLLVTFLWATSWVLIKVGLNDLDLRPLSFAGLRYALAALLLAPLGWRTIR